MNIPWPSLKVNRPIHPVYATVAASAALLVGALCMSAPADTDTRRTHSASPTQAKAGTKTAKTDASLAVRQPAPDQRKLPDALPTGKTDKPKKKPEVSADANAEAKAKPAPERTERTSRDEARDDITTSDPRAWAKTQVSAEQFGCLDALIDAESGWRVDATNPSSGAYGLPQALPGSKMASAGSDWETNGITQLKWGLDYMDDRYGSPCGAWSFHQANNWY